MKRNIPAEIISLLFIFLFMYAAAGKLLDFQKFRVELGKSPMLTSFSVWIAWIIPSVEIGISILLARPGRRLLGLYASFSLMLLFSFYIVAITRFSSYVPCSCGGVLQKMSWDQHLVFNLVFVLLGGLGILSYAEKDDRPLIPVSSRRRACGRLK